MTRSELIAALAKKHPFLTQPDIETIVKTLQQGINDALVAGRRIEIRGFGSFSLVYRPPRIGRNPKTGEKVAVQGKSVVHFKPGIEMRDRVDRSK